MKQIWLKTKRFCAKMRGYFPCQLPRGREEFDKFVDSIFDTYDLPNHKSYKHSIATMIMHLSPQSDTATKFYFAQSIRKAMSNEVAFYIIKEIRDEEQKLKVVDQVPALEPTKDL